MGSKIKQVCPICNTIYLADTTCLKYGRQTTCSRKCSYILRGNQQQNRVERACQRCGKKFSVIASVAQKGAGIYCSRECKHPPQIRTCLRCGKAFRYSPSALRKYCSKSCADASEEKKRVTSKNAIAQWQNPETRERTLQGIKRRSESKEWRSAPHFQRGEAHPRYKGNRQGRERVTEQSRYEYKKWHKNVLIKYDYICQRCKNRGGQLAAHHIKSWAEFPELRYDVENGIALCLGCHDKIHNKKCHNKYHFCIDCGKEKRDRRSPRCHSCATKHYYQSR